MAIRTTGRARKGLRTQTEGTSYRVNNDILYARSPLSCASAPEAPMTARERALHKRLGRLKGELFKAIAYIESIQLLLVSEK